MGMYTELIFGAELRNDTPKEVISILSYLIGLRSTKPKIPDHEFFKSKRWKYLFRMSSMYFAVNKSVSDMWESNGWRISVRSNIKNYDGEIEKFLDWIKPYIKDGSGERAFYAIVCYEGQDVPDIYYLRGVSD